MKSPNEPPYQRSLYAEPLVRHTYHAPRGKAAVPPPEFDDQGDEPFPPLYLEDVSPETMANAVLATIGKTAVGRRWSDRDYYFRLNNPVHVAAAEIIDGVLAENPSDPISETGAVHRIRHATIVRESKTASDYTQDETEMSVDEPFAVVYHISSDLPPRDPRPGRR